MLLYEIILKEELIMSKNYLKVLGLSAVIGALIQTVYELGIKEGRDNAVEEIVSFIPGSNIPK